MVGRRSRHPDLAHLRHRFVTVFYTQKRDLFAGRAEKIFEGIVFLIAAGLLTWMILWMAFMGKKLKTGIEDRVEGFIEAGDKQGKIGIFTMVFVQVLREGIETWIFLFGADFSSGNPEGWRAVPIPGILAIIVGLAVSYMLFRGLAEFDIETFFLVSSVILMAFSAGLVSHGFHELQEADWFGTWNGIPSTERDWWNARMWDTSKCCNDKKNEFFAFLRALFGYQDTPTFVEWSTYFAYWILIISIVVATSWSAVRKARTRIAKIARYMTYTVLPITFVGFIYAVSNATWNGILTMTCGLILSAISYIVVLDFFTAKIRPIGKARRPLALATGIGFAVLTLFMLCLHIAQMACDERSRAKCYIPKFYYLGLIFWENWAKQGRAADGNSWVSIAVLSWSLVGVVFIFGTLAFALIVFAGNVDADGTYRYDISAVKVADDETPLAPENEAVTNSDE